MTSGLEEAFLRARRDGINVGLEELVDAERLLQREGREVAVRLICRLWAKDETQFVAVGAILRDSLRERQPVSEVRPSIQPHLEPDAGTAHTNPETQMVDDGDRSVDAGEEVEVVREEARPTMPSVSVIPVVVRSTDLASPVSAEQVFPLNDRLMRYAWRQLYRTVADGPPDTLDVAGTTERWARQGVLDAPVLRRRERNTAHIVLLIDQTGSMTPFHQYTNLLVESLEEERLAGRAAVFYFKNTPDLFLREGKMEGVLFRDRRLQDPVDAAEALAECSARTTMVIVSDAGAARRRFSTERQSNAIRFLRAVRTLTSRQIWLNPLPTRRWSRTTATIVDALVPMYPMEPEGLKSAVVLLRKLGSGSSR